MKQLTKEELTNLVTKISSEVSETYSEIPNTGDKNIDAIEILVGSITQVQKNCEKIIVETLYQILN